MKEKELSDILCELSMGDIEQHEAYDKICDLFSVINCNCSECGSNDLKPRFYDCNKCGYTFEADNL